MFDDLQNQLDQKNKPPLEQPAPTAPKEDISQRIKGLEEQGRKQDKKKTIYSAIGIVVILLFAGGIITAGYYFWPEIIARVNKLTGKSVEQAPSGDNSGINNQNQTNENAANNQSLALNEEWNKYTSEELGFDFYYPGYWLITEKGKTLAIDAGNSQKIKVFKNSKAFPSIESLPNYEKNYEKIGNKTVIIDNCEVEGELYLDNSDNMELYLLRLSIPSRNLFYQIYFDKTFYEDLSKISGNLISFIKFKENQASTTPAVDLDSDNDELTDVDETKYGTDSNNPDSDGDGYLDGDEVKNGYNPIGEGKLELNTST